ncbi:ABC-three component system protein [Leifsonia xyli]|uniref:ABC-three component system protein n=1 Tax=Leifsonia xyli TaxID=1575 RepID=UPI003D66C833
MFLERLGSTDPKFKSVSLRDGLNILVADRTEGSKQGDSRNSIGKTSFVKVLRYVLGGELPDEFKVPELAEHAFQLTLSLPSARGGTDNVRVTRPVSPTTRLVVDGWSEVQSPDIHVDEWRDLLARKVFNIPDTVGRPTGGQLWGQLLRGHFGKPTKGHASEPDWETGVKLGFMLGLTPEVLAGYGEIDKLSKQGKAIRAAVDEGALTHLSLDEPALRAQVSTARRQRDQMQAKLFKFKVDERYLDHQRKADNLTAAIKRMNDEALALERRSSEINEALHAENDALGQDAFAAKLMRAYSEMGLVLPDAVSRRYDEVAKFHTSILKNRRSFLEQEREAVTTRLLSIELERREFDEERSVVMQLLGETVALDTFLRAQRDLAELDAEVADLERRLESAGTVNAISVNVKLKSAELMTAVRSELTDRQQSLEEAISLFGALGSEIYTDREASLLVSVTAKGILSVKPQISGDASTGVRSVETFMLDMVCAISAMKAHRAPPILVHDSHLFDAIDGRQVASCLNIGARLAEEHGFQYVVTLNSDFLSLVEVQSEGAFDADPYILDTRLTDATNEGGLFGFRFG